MKVKNVSCRLHHVGNVSLAPGEEKDIPDSFKNAINKNELVEVRAVVLASVSKPAVPKFGAPAPAAE